uniref:cell wall hydrolase n=1 Tax=Acetatifactor sp. TaxID=1872090 RepID=UPI004056F482
MYKKAMTGLVVIYLLLLFSFLGIKEIGQNQEPPKPAYEARLDEIYTADAEKNAMGIASVAASGQRTVGYETLDKQWKYELSREDLEALLRIVEAEAGGEDIEGKLLVANVVLNRVENEDFPDTVTEVVFQQSNGVSQFSPVRNGRYWSVDISDETIEAVRRALEGEDISQGALYFAARKYADSDRMKWFDEKLTFLFAHGGHEFFAEPD